MGSSRERGTFAPFRSRNFRWFFAAECTNYAGSTMASVALAFAVLEVDPSPRSLGYVLAAHSIPMLLFVLVGGAVADRLGRAVVVRAGNLISGLSQAALAALVLSGHAQLWHLIVLAAVNGTVSAASLPALWGLMPQMVGREDLQQANVLWSMSRNALMVVGPSASAGLVATVGPGWALAVDAATWLLSAALLLPVRIPAREASDQPSSAWQELKEGWELFWGTQWLWVVVLAFAGLNMIRAFFGVLGPVIAARTFGPEGWGLIGSATAVGLVLTGLLLTRLKLQRVLLPGVVGCFAYLLPLGVLGLTHTLWILVVSAVICGIGIEFFGVGWNLAMQEHIDEDKLSRAYSYDALGSFAAIPLGELIAGPLALTYGERPVLLGGFAVASVLVVLMLCSPQVRTLRRVDAA